MSAPVLVVSDLEKRFGDTVAVTGLSLEVGAGEVLGLAGRNGAGKSSTLAMLSGAVVPDRGSIVLSGEALTRRRRDLRAMIGLVPQEAAVYPELSARDNLACFGGLYGLAGSNLRRRTDEVLELVGLTTLAKQPAARLSGGMRRRLSLAAGLLHQPRLLLLDEPTAGLDLEFRPRLAEIVRGLTCGGTAVVWAGHDLAELERVWDSVIVLDRGRPVARRRVSDLLGRPGTGRGSVEGPLETAVGALLRASGETL